ncbi:PREDICTED: chromosome transmission fidelity protein 18 homolog [Polistes dominula]|uniref:Chromosome transmission fidelity protein 18 homolog n=1 Tax=Polistes dominula TaxID=743375 RepID=A0ABM1IBC8_POLDO|nr:PREDICTED: chromosome transmission fidelity protein 18 homolog [Polistes dominula]
MDEFPDSDEEYDLVHEEDFNVLKEIEAELNNKKNIQNNKEQTSQQTKTQKLFENDYSQITDSKKQQLHLQQTKTKILVENDYSQPSTSFKTIESYNNPISNSRKRNYDELFGDISDLLEKDTFPELIEPKEKRPCWNETDAIIKTVINTRKKLLENDSNISVETDYYQNSEKDNISLRVPPWNFIALTRPFDSQRIYIRMRNEENISIESKKPIRNLLSVSYNQLKAEAEEIIVNNAKRASVAVTTSFYCDETSGTELWVDKYKPQKYIELLSDENVNRQFLYWLKLWDKVVFHKEVSTRKQKINVSTSDKFVDNKQNDLDDKGYPIHKIVLLTGPPGLGKTTLAHLAAKHVGYNIIEVNASDERGPDAFRQILRSSTQMKAVLGKDPRPNCLILDEIDGAPTASIEELIRFVQGKSSSKGKKNKLKTDKEGESCQRPIICICNELYTPSLRSLRNVSLVISVPSVSTTRIVQRLMEIAQKEKLKISQNDLLKLVENCDCDIRSCLGTLQYMGNVNIKHNVSIGLKDSRKGLFDTWKEILKVPFTKLGILSTRDRMHKVLKIVQSGDNEKLVQGIFHNYPINCSEKLQNVSVATEWFQFYDGISTCVLHNQNWSIMPYINYAFLTWHLYLSTTKIPKLFFPIIIFETNQKIAKNTSNLTTVKRNRGNDNITLIMDFTPILPDLLNPQIRTVSGHLYSSTEKANLSRVVNIMIDFGLTLVQEKNAEGKYEYKLNPDIYDIGCFSDCKNRIKIPYTVLQIISQELQIEFVKRFTKVTGITQNNTEKEVENKIHDKGMNVNSITSETSMKKASNASIMSNFLKWGNTIPAPISPKRNLLGETAVPDDNNLKTYTIVSPKSKGIKQIRDIIDKYGVWYKYKEGLTTAVRRQVLIKDLL